MTDLTPELKAAGWKPISEIRQITFNKNDKVELVLVDKQGRRSKPTIETPADIISYEVVADYRDPDMFRRLIPLTSDTIVLSREDAKVLLEVRPTGRHYCDDEWIQKFDLAQINIKAQLEATETKIRQQLGGSDVS